MDFMELNMREIKFRAWDDLEKNFLYFGYKEGLISHCDNQYQKLNIRHIEQFTGLHDKNGKEIYEGDICRVDCGTYIEIDVIKYERSGFKFHSENMPPENDIEVIGNIHENPELMK